MASWSTNADFSELHVLGLDLARLADLPEDVMVESIKISEELSRLNNEKDESSRSAQVAARRRALLKVLLTDFAGTDIMLAGCVFVLHTGFHCPCFCCALSLLVARC